MLKQSSPMLRWAMVFSSCLNVVTLKAAVSLSSSPATTSIIGMDFTDLAKIQITSVAKKEQALMQTAADITVLTGEEIRRSGVRSVPEALRLVPGLEVARTGSASWAISARGFNGALANKLLVLIDGRSVYTPLYGGVFWDVQNVQLDNIDRIEVIRGPGAAVWGANAVNGVINIITKHTAETQGGRVSGGGGTEERGFVDTRYGGHLGETGQYRVYGSYFERDGMKRVGAGDAGDGSKMGYGGFRGDWCYSDRDLFTLSTDIYSGTDTSDEPFNTLTPPFSTVKPTDTDLNGGNVKMNWERKFSPRSGLEMQMYYDRTQRKIPLLFSEQRNTYDIDVRHHFSFLQRQNIIWGFGYRASQDSVSNDTFGLDFLPDAHTMQNANIFFQDEFRPWRPLIFTIGSKFEYNDYSGFEFEPNGRVSWLINKRNTLWGSVSRAVRTPTRFDRDVRVSAVVNPTPLTAISYRGDPSFDSEDLVAYEMGYRTQPTRRFYLTTAGFYNVYNNLQSIEPGPIFVETDPMPAHTVVPAYLQNKLNGETYGFQISPELQVTDWCKFQAGYSYFHMKLHLDNDSLDTVSIASERNNPSNQFIFRGSFNLPYKFEFDGTFRYVDNLPNLDIASYAVADARVGWRGIRHVNLELIGQNLFETHHAEFRPGNEVERGVYGRATWDF